MPFEVKAIQMADPSCSNSSAGSAASPSGCSRRDPRSPTGTSSEPSEHGAANSTDAGRSPTTSTGSTSSSTPSRRVQPRQATPLPRLIPEGRIMQRTPRNGNTHSRKKQRTRRTERSAGRSEPPIPATRRQPNRPTGSAKNPEPCQVLDNHSSRYQFPQCKPRDAAAARTLSSERYGMRPGYSPSAFVHKTRPS